MFPPFIKIKKTALDILFPPVCLNCQDYLNTPDGLICKNCLSTIKIHNSLFCPICGLRLFKDKKICNHERKKSDKYPYFLGAATNYDNDAIRNLIHYFKYKSFKNIAPLLGNILVNYTELIGFQPKDYVITPIPLHPRKEKQRGFNQSELLSKFLAEHYNLPVIDSLKRVRHTEPQARFNKSKRKISLLDGISEILEDGSEISENYEKRRKNISGAFSITDTNEIKGKNIILIDDVYTSGATMSEAARILKAGGAKKIIALVVAKTQS